MAKPAPANRKSMLWIQGAACGALLTFAMPTAVLLGSLLAPAVACGLAEVTENRGTTRAVTLCGAAAAFSPVWRLWMTGAGDLNVSLAMLSDPFTIVSAWGACACAWAACQVLPVIIRTAWNVREAARSNNIRAELGRCREEWDLDLPNKTTAKAA